MTIKRLIIVFNIMFILFLISGCSSTAPENSQTDQSKGTSSNVNLSGAGATFPQYLYTKWFDEYYKMTGIKINYQGIGSSGGVQQISASNVDFGASDGIVSGDQLIIAEKAGGPLLHIAMTSGAIAVVYNLPGISSGQVKLTGTMLADIYLKKITRWNDPAITALNEGIPLPDSDIVLVHRADGSGTTFIFTNYLSKVNEDWKNKIGNGTSVSWQGDIAGQGNAGVAGQVQQVPNSIGYVEMAYAKQNKMSWALLQNSSGNYLEPTLTGTTRASEGVVLPDDMKIMITNSKNPEAYPICGFTWILVYQNQPDALKGKALAEMLWWAVHAGQQYSSPLDYAPLSDEAVLKAETQILLMQFQNQPLITR